MLFVSFINRNKSAICERARVLPKKILILYYFLKRIHIKNIYLLAHELPMKEEFVLFKIVKCNGNETVINDQKIFKEIRCDRKFRRVSHSIVNLRNLVCNCILYYKHQI